MVVIVFKGDTVNQQPDFVALHKPANVICGISLKLAAAGAIKKIRDSGNFIKGDTQADENGLPMCLPLPALAWVPNFLAQRQTPNKDPNLQMSKWLAKWTVGGDETLSMVLARDWFQAGYTCHPSLPDNNLQLGLSRI
jgi:hypothetical protein